MVIIYMVELMSASLIYHQVHKGTSISDYWEGKIVPFWSSSIHVLGTSLGV